MSNLVVHFEIHGSDPARLADFYERLLGWSFQQFGDMPYWAIDTGDEAASQGGVGHGINGGLTQRQGPAPEIGGAVNGANLVIARRRRRRPLRPGPRAGRVRGPRAGRHARRRALGLPPRPRRQRLRPHVPGPVRRHHRDGWCLRAWPPRAAGAGTRTPCSRPPTSGAGCPRARPTSPRTSTSSLPTPTTSSPLPRPASSAPTATSPSSPTRSAPSRAAGAATACGGACPSSRVRPVSSPSCWRAVRPSSTAWTCSR